MTTPIDLYRVVMGSDVWTFTGATTDQFYNAGSGTERYVSTAIGRGGYDQKNEISKSNMELELSLEHPLAVMLLMSYFEQIITLTMFTDRDGVISTSWKGRLSAVKPSDNSLTLNFESVFTSLRRPGLRARFQKSCRYALYGRGCFLDPEDFVLNTTLSAISGRTLTVPGASGQANGYYTGGMIRAPDGALSYVVSHSGTSITVQRVSSSMATAFASTGAATAVKLYPGCDHSRATCAAKFSNGVRYGGFDWIPEKNPLGGNSIV